MSDIFDEVTAELRRDNAAAAWDKYGPYVIGAAVAVVVTVAGVVGYDSYAAAQEEAASLRYDAALEEVADSDPQVRIDALQAFAAAEDNGYGVLAEFTAALELAAGGQNDAAQAAFDRLADDGRLPDSLRDLAALQAAVVLLNSGGALEAIELRLDPMLTPEHGLRAMARETMAMAYMAHDKPLQARDQFKAQLADPQISTLTGERANIMLQSLGAVLTPPPPAALSTDADANGKD